MLKQIFDSRARPRYFLRADESFLSALWRQLVRRQSSLPDFPTDVQIETVTGCNARCIFCPSGNTKRTIIAGRKMPMDLYRKIVDELLARGVRRISPYLNNEPLMDNELPERISYITQRKPPPTFTKINTNGALLTEDMAKRLLDSGLDRLNFSVHGIVPEVYEHTMVGLKLEIVLRNIDRFLELKRAGGYDKPRVRVTMVKTKILEPQIPAILDYWTRRNVKVNIRTLENRVNRQIEEKGLEVCQLLPFTWCDRMFEQAHVLSDGRVVLCCADWEESTIFGDLKNSTLHEIWHNEKYRQHRRQFLRGDLRGLLCATCRKESV
jgi:MoaA/NifB/PqqE/SkfB family radical SAM enzyme